MKTAAIVLWSLIAMALAIPLDSVAADPDAEICQAFCDGACPEGWTKKADDTGAGAAQALIYVATFGLEVLRAGLVVRWTTGFAGVSEHLRLSPIPIENRPDPRDSNPSDDDSSNSQPNLPDDVHGSGPEVNGVDVVYRARVRC
ncbi:uncharacterized protein CCOS01_11906 [Colletotrichum costaricense]|uniref:Uncharacterized protein n=1 Tax=Colletotrichum costaricense TaxID=1209916 RepID=A0AAI9YNM2_9PEZI|nr:uncharacterized protein CCOS01_11906 [Colletotrichum costaricense]KAK1517649.1 hypothetical protein CCOS01_11906 [Colletotrichum costaricense]